MVKRKVDELGRVVLPRDYREALNLGPGTPLSMDLVGDKIVITKLVSTCALCQAELEEERDICLCDKCIRKVKKL